MRDSTVLSPLVVTAQPGLNRAAAGPAVLALAAVSAASVTALVNPFEHHLSPPCPFHALTGLWCPFCGGTRAVWALAHGDFRLMLHADALFPLIAAAAVWGWLAWLGRVTGWWRLPMPRGRATAVVAVGLLVVFTVVRNLAGFGLLAPPASS